MNYIEQFPRFDDTLPTLEGFFDSSWHNDACPSICKDLGGMRYLQVFIDYKDQTKSDFADIEPSDYLRFRVYLDKPSELMNPQFLKDSNDWAEIEQFIKELKL